LIGARLLGVQRTTAESETMPVENSIDHVVVSVHDLDHASEEFKAAGFNLTPRAYHSGCMGTSNRLAQFAGMNFIELLEVDRPDGISPHAFDAAPPRFSFGAHNRAFLQNRTGMSMMVFHSTDARADLARFDALGLSTYAPFDFERHALLPDGSQVVVAFTLGFVTSPLLPGLAFFVCQQHSPEHFWKRDFQSHDNGAQSIAAVYISAARPENHVEFLLKLTGGSSTKVDGGQRVSFGDQEVLVLVPERICAIAGGSLADFDNGPHFAGIALRSSADNVKPFRPNQSCNMFIEWRQN
jgi:hypothetical protein